MLSRSSLARVSRLGTPACENPLLRTCRRPASACAFARLLRTFKSRSISSRPLIALPFLSRFIHAETLEHSFDDCVRCPVRDPALFLVMLEVFFQQIVDLPVIPRELLI